MKRSVEVPKNSGRSKSAEFPHGVRRKQEGKERAPMSARRNGKTWLSECTSSELEKAGIV